MPRLDLSHYAGALSAIDAGGALTAVLGPTNTGKTYYALERMLSHESGMIGLPLRLLAREVYDKLVARVGERAVALVTGEEKRVPPNPRYWVSTVEAMPLEKRTAFLAIDEVQLAQDEERGQVFTNRLLHARGTKETVLLGSETMRPVLRRLFPDISFVSRERFSTLSYAGVKKVTRLPRRAAIVAFSADMVYAIAELVRRQRGGAAVVLGALSPRTRNAQAELYQSGEVDYLIATDAIGMGLNMDIDYVAFAAARKFDGRRVRDLRVEEAAQIAGRAGRHVKDGAFGATADCRGFSEEMVEAIENHAFPMIESLQWRPSRLDFSSVESLTRSLDQTPPEDGPLRRARPAEDELSLARLGANREIRERAQGIARVNLLWDVCQIPDFRKLAFDQHARLLAEIFEQLCDDGRIGEVWLAPQVERLDRIDGDIDAISTRIAHVRTWTYLANRSGWIENEAHWRQKTRAIEDRLSDALHEKLTQRFVDRRTAVLLRKLRDDAPLLAGISDDGEVTVEGQFVGRLLGFEFIIDPRVTGPDAKRLRYAAEKALRPTLAARAAALANAETSELTLKGDGTLWWRASAVGVLEKGPAPLRPTLRVRGLEAIHASLRGRVVDRLTEFVASRIEALLGDLISLKRAVDQGEAGGLSGVARGVAFQLFENFGAMSRTHLSAELKQIDQEERSRLRKLGMRFGEYTLFMPALLKPAPARLLTMLWAIWTERAPADFEPPKAGLVSLAINKDLPHAYYYASGYRPSGERAVRIDMLERLAGQIRSARNDGDLKGAFEASPQMMSLVGCSGEEFESILVSLGYRKQTVTVKRPAPRAEAAAPPEASATSADDANEEAPADGSAPNVGAASPSGPADPASPAEAAEPSPAESGSDADSPDVVADSPGAADGTPALTAGVDARGSDEASADNSGVIASASAEILVDTELTVWRMAPRGRPENRRKPPRRDGNETRAARGEGAERGPRSQGAPGKGGHHRKSGPPGKGGKPQREQGPRTFNAGPRRKGPDPDSPFAVLAALKNRGDDGSAGN